MTSALACHDCGARCDDLSNIDPAGLDLPDDGDVSVCAYCACIAIYTGNGLDRRPPTPTELQRLENDPNVRHVVKVLRSPINTLRGTR